MTSSLLLEQLADDFAAIVPTVDTKAEHDRWQAGIGPFEEDRQIEMLRGAVEGDTSYSIETEVPYLDGGQRVDLFIKSDLNASHKREKIETDLIGVYYLEVGEAPLAQFGHTENVPP